MSEQTTTVCDGCGEAIDTRQTHIRIMLWGLLEWRRMGGGDDAQKWANEQHLHGVPCIALWLEKMPREVRMQLTDRTFAR